MRDELVCQGSGCIEVTTWGDKEEEISYEEVWIKEFEMNNQIDVQIW